jgi:uncharacterized protein (DUF1330 family)
MPAYLIANIEVTDPEGFAAYGRLVAPLVASTGGKYLVRGGALTKVEGDLPLKRLVILEYPTLAALRAFYDGADYAPIKAMREKASKSDISLVEGYAPL